jgi:hypothetical protein
LPVIPWFSAANGPKSDPSFWHPFRRTNVPRARFQIIPVHIWPTLKIN